MNGLSLIRALESAKSSFVEGETRYVAIDEAIRVIEQAQEVNGRLRAEVEELKASIERRRVIAKEQLAFLSEDAWRYRTLLAKLADEKNWEQSYEGRSYWTAPGCVNLMARDALNPPKPEEQT